METTWRQKAIFYLSLIGFFGIFSTTISKNPVLPLYVHALGANESLLGIIAAASPLAGMVLSLPIGFLSDQLGRKKLLIISGLVFVIAPLLYLIVQNPILLIPIRFFHGSATAILGPVAAAMVVSWYPHNKGEKLGIYSSATLIGRTLAPLLGGLIISYLAILDGLIKYQVVYLAAFLLAIPVLVLVLMYPFEFPTHHQSSVRMADLLLVIKDFVSNKLLAATSLVQMVTYFSFGVLETYLPLYLVSVDIPVSQIGLIFSLQVLSIALTTPLFGRLSDRIDKRLQLLAGVSILAVVMFTIPHVTILGLLIFESLIFGIGISMVSIAANTLTAELVQVKQLGSSFGALSTIMDVGQTLGPFIVGMLITAISLTYGFIFCAVLIVTVAIIFGLVSYQKRR